MVASYIMFMIVFSGQWDEEGVEITSQKVNVAIVGFVVFIFFNLERKVYINLKKLKFRPTTVFFNWHWGNWKTIKDPEYVSIFYPNLSVRSYKVNLWYDKKRHWELYEKNDFDDAFKVAFEISELLNIDLLDATVPKDYRWVDKEKHRPKFGQKRIEQ